MNKNAFLVDYSGVGESYGGKYRYYFPIETSLPEKYKEHVFIVHREDLYDDIMFNMFTLKAADFDIKGEHPTLSEIRKYLKPSEEWYPIFPALAQLLENALIKSEYQILRTIYNYYRDEHMVLLDLIFNILKNYEVPDDEIVTVCAALRYFTPD